MKIIISPAKSLNFESKSTITEYTQPILLPYAERLNKILKKKSARVLSKLMSISDNLGSLNYERNQEWNLPFTVQNAKQAIFAFTGEVYRGLDVNRRAPPFLICRVNARVSRSSMPITFCAIR